MILIGDTANTNLSVNELKKYRQKKYILRLLYKYETLSAPELSKYINVTLPTTVSLLNDLIAAGIISERGIGSSKGGRKPILYGLAEDSYYVIACDMGRYNAKLAIFDTYNKAVVPEEIVETHIDDPELVNKIYAVSSELINKYRIPDDRIIGVGIDMPGLVDSVNGINYTIKDLRFQNVRQRFEEKFHKMIYVDNDARMQAFGEFIFGKAKGHNNAIIINWSWGLGLGMILNGRLYRGTTGFAGELSHIQAAEDGDLCICGKKGCLETVASAKPLLKKAKEGIHNGAVSQLTNRFRGREDELTPEHIINAAKSGDEFSISILNSIGMAFGKGLSVIIQLLNPEIIILSGPLSKANQFVLTPIHQALNKYCLEQIIANTEIVLSSISEKSGLLGITAKLYQKVFSDMIS